LGGGKTVDAINQDADAIVDALANSLPARIDGREAILAMKGHGSKNWRQMEWIGFWLEHLFESMISSDLDASPGPVIGNTRFDVQRQRVWDLKAHPVGVKQLILNDAEAVDQCIKQYDGVGFIIVTGEVQYDESGEFKTWHDELKGGTSPYEKERVDRGAPSRRRKVSFEPTHIDAAFIPSIESLESQVVSGELKDFQTDMRNSNGKPRRAKYLLPNGHFPSRFIVATKKLV
jgi:hypothetical protein